MRFAGAKNSRCLPTNRYSQIFGSGGNAFRRPADGRQRRFLRIFAVHLEWHLLGFGASSLMTALLSAASAPVTCGRSSRRNIGFVAGVRYRRASRWRAPPGSSAAIVFSAEPIAAGFVFLSFSGPAAESSREACRRPRLASEIGDHLCIGVGVVPLRLLRSGADRQARRRRRRNEAQRRRRRRTGLRHIAVSTQFCTMAGRHDGRL